MRDYIKNRYIQILVLLVCLAIGSIIGWNWHIYYEDHIPNKSSQIRLNSSEYKFINPLFLSESARRSPEYNGLQNDISSFIEKSKADGDITDASVYFRDLNQGKWTGVNEDKLYDPSSTLKVAVMIGYLNASESDPDILNQKIHYTDQDDEGQYYKPQKTLATGFYTANELIKAMIVDSDNNALAALYDNGRQAFVNVLKDLEIDPPPTESTLNFMSPKTYSKIFRTLYNATYLSRKTSEQALKLLSSTNFNSGLVASIPKDIVVAHKFGEHTDAKNGIVTSRQLHDCGIVYASQKPYFLCIMSTGNDFPLLQKTIVGISNLVYKKISSN